VCLLCVCKKWELNGVCVCLLCGWEKRELNVGCVWVLCVVSRGN
jgi:hypothetical protein